MSYGPLKNCYKCKTPLDLNDPGNGGYCGGHHCLYDPPPENGPTPLGPNRKQRRATAREARKKAGVR